MLASEVLRIIVALAGERGTTVIVAHELAFAREVPTRAAFMHYERRKHAAGILLFPSPAAWLPHIYRGGPFEWSAAGSCASISRAAVMGSPVRMRSMRRLRPFGEPIMIAPTRVFFLKNNLRY